MLLPFETYNTLISQTVSFLKLCTATEVKEAILPEDKFTLGESTKVKLVGFNHMVPTSPYMVVSNFNTFKSMSSNERASTRKTL